MTTNKISHLLSLHSAWPRSSVSAAHGLASPEDVVTPQSTTTLVHNISIVDMVCTGHLLFRCLLLASAAVARARASPSWSLRRLSSRNMHAHTRRLEAPVLAQQSYSAMEVRPRLTRRIPGATTTAARASPDTLSKIFQKDFAIDNVIKSGTTVLVDVPASFIGRYIYSFHVESLMKGGGAVLEMISAGRPRRGLFSLHRPSCRLRLTASVQDKDIVLMLKLASTDIGIKDMEALSASLFDAVFKFVNGELKIAAAHQRLLERNRIQIEAAERARNQKTLQSIIEPERFTRLATSGPGTGAPRYKPGSSLQERRAPRGAGS